jgi:DNA modification methylase
MNYEKFLESKQLICPPAGIDPAPINPQLFQFQRDIVRWALRRGRAAIFADCGLGKTPMQLEWARQISEQGNVLILAPLAVAEQTVAEGEKFGVKVRYCRHQADAEPGITITNYEMLEHFDASSFAGIVLDESSILKDYTSKTRNQIIAAFQNTPYRLACTATPAPNDYMELGNHAEFLGVMTRTEMLSMFFVHDGGDTSKWRVKGHAESEFWKWVCSWGVMLRKPSDLGYDDGGFILSPLQIEQTTVSSEALDGFLFAMQASTLPERIAARRKSTSERAQACAEIVNATDEAWVIWCNLNNEADELELSIKGAVQVKGSERLEHKATKLRAFSSGGILRMVSKPSIAGRGLNWQHCRNVAFVGLSDSWEDYYQAVRRCWRFGQTKPVRVVLITAEAEGAVLANIMRKERDADRMATEMINNMHTINEENIKGTVRTSDCYKVAQANGDGWEMHLGDCVDVTRSLRPESVDFSIFSPPFASLYTYSASERDMGNSRGYDEFARHFAFLVTELFRVLKSGRLVSFHCWNTPTTKSHHGYIGIQDFRGDLIRMFQAAGFIFHSEVCIWKDPVTAMQRTKALGLLWKQIKKDSSMSRQGVPDYLVTMRKPGENAEFISHSADAFPVEQWQQWASPVWMDINPSDTLQFRSAREHKDERHICPLQLEVIRRALVLWSNPGDVVLSPFAGIGSEGYMALGGSTITGAAVEKPRKFIGVELKESYFRQATKNLMAAQSAKHSELFATCDQQESEAVA